ncbi:hypothetical protein ON010_g6606 [Phytophthora cinnamomi]|nr:hypothetical protein ON010_g6606 [Phytophthora cinnamomi]
MYTTWACFAGEPPAAVPAPSAGDRTGLQGRPVLPRLGHLALQEASEAYLVGLFTDTNLCMSFVMQQKACKLTCHRNFASPGEIPHHHVLGYYGVPVARTTRKAPATPSHVSTLIIITGGQAKIELAATTLQDAPVAVQHDCVLLEVLDLDFHQQSGLAKALAAAGAVRNSPIGTSNVRFASSSRSELSCIFASLINQSVREEKTGSNGAAGEDQRQPDGVCRGHSGAQEIRRGRGARRGRRRPVRARRGLRNSAPHQRPGTPTDAGAAQGHVAREHPRGRRQLAHQNLLYAHHPALQHGDAHRAVPAREAAALAAAALQGGHPHHARHARVRGCREQAAQRQGARGGCAGERAPADGCQQVHRQHGQVKRPPTRTPCQLLTG